MRHLSPARLAWLLLLGGSGALAAASVASPTDTRRAAGQTWSPFVLVAGLLLVGVAAHRDGLFAALGGAVGRLRVPAPVLLVALLVVVAVVTAVLNLDTSVAFLTPVLVLAARKRGLDEEPFLYGTLLMSNAASLLLPGSNLTNLLVLAGDHVSGAVFAARMYPAWIAAVVVTAGFTLVMFRSRIATAERAPHDAGAVPDRDRARIPVAWSALAVGIAVVFVLVLRSPAVPVVGLGAAVAGLALARRSLSGREIWDAVEPASLAGVFGLAVALGALARGWSGPAHLMAHAGGAETAAIGAVASVVVNNLPAAVLLGARHPAHPRALLLGLDLGPNLAVTGSLSALIWFRAARTVGAHPSAARLSRLGVVVAPLSIVMAALALHLFVPAGI